ncbi:MAG: glycosyl hydrolase [Actinomycetota bacterium]
MWHSRASQWRRRSSTLLALALVAALLGSISAPKPADAATLNPATLGQRPSGSFLDADRMAKAERELDAQLNWYVAMAGRQSPADMKGSVYGQLRNSRAVLPTVADRMNLVMTVPLAFGKQTARTEAGRDDIRSRLLTTASGSWDDDFRQVAEALVEGGYGDAVIRLGHEFTGGWYPWSAQGNADAYIAAYRHVHEVLRSVSPNFTFEWNAARNTFIEYGPPAYPGDAYVDIVGLDVYYEPWKGDKALTDDYWNRRYQRVLEAHQQFAAERGKPVSYAEWGNGGVDEPAFIEAMHGWFSSLPASGPGSLLYHSYFNVTKDLYNLDAYPRSKETYLRLFGGGGAASAESPSVLIGNGSNPGNPPPPPEPEPDPTPDPEPPVVVVDPTPDPQPEPPSDPVPDPEPDPQPDPEPPVSPGPDPEPEPPTVTTSPTQFSLYDQALVHRADEYATTDFAAPADWRSPTDFVDGTTYVRLHITDKPSDKPVQLISCMWRDRYTQEKCLGFGVFENEGLHYLELKSPGRWWTADRWSWDRPIEFVRILAKDPATGRLLSSASCGSVCYPGDDLGDHTPISFEAELIVVADGEALEAPDDWAGCPAAWGGTCADGDPGDPTPDPNGPNPPPVSNVDPTLELPDSAVAEQGTWMTLSAETDAPEIVWWKHRGPGSVSWADKRVTDPTLRFHATGTYVLAATARNNGRTTRGYVTVEVGQKGSAPVVVSTTTTAPPPTTAPPSSQAPTTTTPTTAPAPTTTPTTPPPTTAPAPTGLPTVSVRPTSAAEGTPLVFKVVLDRVADHDVTVVVETADITAEAGLDYQARRETLIIPAGERRAWLGVPTVSDGVSEPDEEVRLRIVESSGAEAADNAKGTIT